MYWNTQNFIKTLSEVRHDGHVLLVRVTAEVMSLQMRFEIRKTATLSQFVWQVMSNHWLEWDKC